MSAHISYGGFGRGVWLAVDSTAANDWKTDVAMVTSYALSSQACMQLRRLAWSHRLITCTF